MLHVRLSGVVAVGIVQICLPAMGVENGQVDRIGGQQIGVELAHLFRPLVGHAFASIKIEPVRNCGGRLRPES
jgi:hypothetical protein